jgi:hypothetical protein
MKRHLPALLVLILLASGAAFGSAALRQRVAAVEEENTSLETEFELLQSSLAERSRETEARAEADQAVQRFLDAWTPHWKHASAADPVDQMRTRLQQEAANLTVATSNWTAPAPVETGTGSSRMRTQSCSVRVSGLPTRVLLWLGRAGEIMPAARVQRAEILASGNGITLEVRWSLPLPGPAST